MSVAEAFKTAAPADFNIDNEALYLLSGNGVSDETRVELLVRVVVPGVVTEFQRFGSGYWPKVSAKMELV
jgi:hypothetical protein